MISADGNIEHVKKFAFEYKRVGSLAVARIFGVAVFKNVGDLSVLFGVNWIGHANANY